MTPAATARKPRSNRKAKTPLSAVPAAPGAIVIPPKCKPSKVVSPDRTRPVLTHAYLRRRKGDLWLCATDSYIAVAIKVSGDAEDGYIPVGALRLMERGQKGEQISKTAWKVWTNEGTVVFDCADQLKGAVEYPDFDKLGVFDGPQEDDPLALDTKDRKFRVGINPDLMKRIGEGIGANGYGCRFEFVAPLRPIRVLPMQADGDRLGLCMPIRLTV